MRSKDRRKQTNWILQHYVGARQTNDLGPGRRKGPTIFLQKSIVFLIVVSRWFDQIELLASFVLCHFFPLLAGVFHWWTAGADAQETIVSDPTVLRKSTIHFVHKSNFFPRSRLVNSLVGIQKRISQGLKVLQYYTTKNWIFKNENFLRMKDKMSPMDLVKFNFSVEDVRI